MSTQGADETSRRTTDRGFECLDAVSAGEAHRSQDGDALLGGRVGAERGGPHGAVTGGGPKIHRGGQSERFSKVWKNQRRQNLLNC